MKMSIQRMVGFVFAACLTLGAQTANAQVPPPPSWRKPQPLPPPTAWTRKDSADGMTTYYTTPTSNFPESDPWVLPTNLLPTVYADVDASNGVPIPNTLPSTPEHPYNLFAKPPVVTKINPMSPADDLAAIYKNWYTGGHEYGCGPEHTRLCRYDPSRFDAAALQRGIDVLEGNPIPNRVYSGIPMLHYNGPNGVADVEPIYDANGNPIGGNVTVHQVWFLDHIESSTSFIDPAAMETPALRNLPWTITYIVDAMDRGSDDFSPMEMFFDDPDITGKPKPLVMMDATFYPMIAGTRTVFVIKEPPARFFNLIYTWGWREHPGRILVYENALKSAMGKTLPQWEIDTFGANPRENETSKEAAIAMIGDLAPAKRMWRALKTLQQTGYDPVVMKEYERAFHEWNQRDRLPDGVKPDPNADITLFYVNDEIFGQMRDFARHSHHPELYKWHLRGTKVTVKLINGDYFPHAYVAVDFGGLRGWENTFQNTIPLGGDGPWFTFGRDYWEPITNSPAVVPAAVPGKGSMTFISPAAQALALSRMSESNKAPSQNQAMALENLHRFGVSWFDPDAKTWPKVMPMANILNGKNGDVLGEHTVVLTLNFEPSKRLRLYQFDPLHHIEAIWSVH